VSVLRIRGGLDPSLAAPPAAVSSSSAERLVSQPLLGFPHGFMASGGPMFGVPKVLGANPNFVSGSGGAAIGALQPTSSSLFVGNFANGLKQESHFKEQASSVPSQARPHPVHGSHLTGNAHLAGYPICVFVCPLFFYYCTISIVYGKQMGKVESQNGNACSSSSVGTTSFQKTSAGE